MESSKWFDRKFRSIEDNGLLPGIIERLEGTPIRLDAKIRKMSADLLSQKSADKWSVKKEVGHLNDLEPLWFERIIQIQSGITDLTAADLTNRKTQEADHDERSIKDLLNDFSSSREKLVAKLRSLSDEDLQKSSLHPCLQIPMKIVELAYFVAEHDDHHLAQISSLMEGAS